MREGAVISGVLHGGLLVLAIFGTDWFKGPETPPLLVTEIEMIDGTDFDAAVSSAPQIVSEGPDDLSPPPAADAAPVAPKEPEADAPAPAPAAPELAAAPKAEPVPSAPEIAVPPPPRNVPTEDPEPTIAEIPAPDPLDKKATVPESPPATEPLQPLAPRPSPVPLTRPTPPPQPEPEPEQPVEVAEVKDKAPDAVEDPKPEPEPVKAPDPESVKEEAPNVEEGAAPQTAAIPVARPARIAAAATPASRQEKLRELAKQQQAEREAAAKAETPKKAARKVADAAPKAAAPKPKTGTPKADAKPREEAGGGNKRRGRPLSRGEKNALRVGLKKHYYYSGDISDTKLAVMIRVNLSPDGRIISTSRVRDQGGTAGSRRALFQAGVRTLKKAERAGEFRKLPTDKYDQWQRLNIVFTISGVGRVGS